MCKIPLLTPLLGTLRIDLPLSAFSSVANFLVVSKSMYRVCANHIHLGDVTPVCIAIAMLSGTQARKHPTYIFNSLFDCDVVVFHRGETSSRFYAGPLKLA